MKISKLSKCQTSEDDQRSACGLTTEGIRKAIESMTGK